MFIIMIGRMAKFNNTPNPLKWHARETRQFNTYLNLFTLSEIEKANISLRRITYSCRKRFHLEIPEEGLLMEMFVSDLLSLLPFRILLNKKIHAE